jgi:hypothetical protein
MMEKITLLLPEQFLQENAAIPLSPHSFYREFSRPENVAAMQKLLSNYHYEDKAEVTDCEIVEDRIRINTDGSGTVYVKYRLHYFLACSGINYDEKDNMTITFQCNWPMKTVQICSAARLERSDEL